MSAPDKFYYSVNTGSPFSLPSGTSETTILTISPSQNTDFRGIYLDLVNLTQDATIRVRHDINNNGTFITFDSQSYVAGGARNAVLMGISTPFENDLRITIQSTVAEGVSRNIPFRYFYSDIGNINS